MPETTILGFRHGAPRRLLVVQGPQGLPGEIAASLLATRLIVAPFTGVTSIDGQGALEEIEGHAQAAQAAAARAIAMSITLGG